jgi:hypothetical protein
MLRRAIAILSLFAVTQTGCMTAFAAFQPENVGGDTIVITTFDGDGKSYDRVLSPIEDDGQLFISVNHWPRAWYWRVLDNPNVTVTRGGQKTDYTAVRLSGAERDYMFEEHGFPWPVYIFTGFAPREFLRLDPR